MGRATLLAVSLAAVIAWVAAGCEREKRQFRQIPATAAGQPVSMSDLHPSGSTPPPPSKLADERNAWDLSEGKRLYSWFNCVGCHAQGGGGMGPPLMDKTWIYGSDPANIFATIVEGRPNGMPSFRGKIPEYQVWQLVAYVRSLSGQAPSAAAPGRSDHMSARPAEAQMPKQAPVKSDRPPQSERRP